jgi:anionic cell wall polymer biosynthesis LytR-Cps2A-Psr (LCP) family protein
MDADMVLWYVRSRKTTNDIARNRRQQEVLQALFGKLLSLNAIRRAPEFYVIYHDSVKTDIGLGDVLTWLPLAAKIAETREINQYYITYKQVTDWITPEGAMVLVPNQQALMNVIRKSQNMP